MVYAIEVCNLKAEKIDDKKNKDRYKIEGEKSNDYRTMVRE